MDQEEILANRLVEYCVKIAEEFVARQNRIRVFVKHNLTSGNANEEILRDFLQRHSPGVFEVAQGFICNPLGNNGVSRQCDILIYDRSHHPLIYQDGPVKVVWPDSVRMVVESKTKFKKADIKAAVKNIGSAKSVPRIHEDIIDFKGFIFAFDTPRVETVLKHLKVQLPLIDERDQPDAILLFDRGVIIERTRNFRQYTVVQSKCTHNKGAIVLTYLLVHFYYSVWGQSGIGLVEVLRQLQINHTVPIDTVPVLNIAE